jgi:hypothetical protein
MPAALRPPRALRLRPGERPTWWRACDDRQHLDAWRAAAAAHRLPVDALVAVLLEIDLVADDLRRADLDPIPLLTYLSARPDAVGRLGPAGALRSWLAPAALPEDTDELPELVLPERLVARLTPGSPIAPRLGLDHVELALTCDRCAAAQGRTLESWALHAVLVHAGVALGRQALG